MTYIYLGLQGNTQNHRLESMAGVNKLAYLTLPSPLHQEQEPNLEPADPAPGSPGGE